MSFDEDYDGDYDYEDLERARIFADPGGNSALRAANADNPRNLPCPNCGVKNRLTPADQARGYQCDTCADRAENGMDFDYGDEDDGREEPEDCEDPLA